MIQRLVLIFLIGTQGWAMLVVWGQTEEGRALQGVLRELQELEERVAKQQEDREEGYRRLRSVELEISNVSGRLSELRAQKATVATRREGLSRETQAAKDQLDHARDQLAEQVRVAYLLGRQERLKLFFSQESLPRLGRMLVYHDYLNTARSTRVHAVTNNIDILAQLLSEVDETALALLELEQAQEGALERLENAQEERELMLARMDEAIRRSSGEVNWLEEEAQRLSELVVKIQDRLEVFSESEEPSFSSIKGSLNWPVAGPLLRDYGQSRTGGDLTWNGVLLQAPLGASVNAIYYGRVVYADWLPGLGLLIIVDHGGDYMSLYGHNETILTELGARVSSGETIALTGQSGGQAQPALYFEIRHSGEPINPHSWIDAR
ncbi:MAG: peptidoglycan DD-metalloendopeptidase family protein [Pseudomonadota bacterium]|nr:peptidoglycan DD-metalloendopeptidase family protein [Pseudomonadota bacterium]